MVADAGGVVGEAWTCDGKTNGKFFFKFVCPSTWLLDGFMVADPAAVSVAAW